MKKAISLVLTMLMVLSFAACNNGGGDTKSSTDSKTESTASTESKADDTKSETPAEGTYEIALVTDVGNIDDKSFNQGTWEGVKAYAEDAKVTYNYYRPTEDSTTARVETIKTAIDKGAKVVVMPGYLFGGAIVAVQEQYPDVMFLGIDVSEGDLADEAGNAVKAQSNVALINYQEEQAGYLAGFAAVKNGFKKLAFLGGMEIPAVQRYGYGFVQGADAAAKEMNIADQVSMKYWYCGGFAPTDDIKTKVSGWYTEGTEVVFSCGGGIYLSATAAAETAGAKVIGVDVDQSAESATIVTSAMKELSESVKVALTDLYANGGKWDDTYAGKAKVLGAADNCVGLPTAADSWRLANYSVEDYNALFADVSSGKIAVSNAIDAAPAVAIAVDYLN
jgi:basic membrane protein A